MKYFNNTYRLAYLTVFLPLFGLGGGLLSSCTDDFENTIPENNGAESVKGEMIQFAAGTTVNSVTTRADGSGNSNYNETPGVTYYMPIDHRFVCRMYYKASTDENAKYDVKGGSDVTVWMRVGNDEGNSLYWRNTFPTLDKTNPNLFDLLGNDIEATCLYWQNRMEHAFLAWTDLNRATTIGYSPEKFSNSLKFVPADVNFEKHFGDKVDQWVDNGFEVYGAPDDFVDWAALRSFMETDNNYEAYVKGKTPDGISESDFDGKVYYYAYGKSCKYSEVKAEITNVDPLHQKYGWMQYQMFYDKLTYTGAKTGSDIVVKKNDQNIPTHLFNTATNKYLAEIEIKYLAVDDAGNVKDPEEVYIPKETDINARTGEVLDPATVLEDDKLKNGQDAVVAQCKFVYYLTDEYGDVRYDETKPRYTFYYQKLQEKRNVERVEIFPANEFDLTRKPVMDSQGNITSYGINNITEQPDICLALTKQIPLGATQASNRVNLYFKHQFSQIQVNIKSSADLSVVVGKNNIQKVELLGVTEKGYVFTEINEQGNVEPANYETVDVSKYSDEHLKNNQYGTAFEMFDMATGKNEAGEVLSDTNKDTWHDAGYPLGYIKAYNAIAFGQLQAIRITWNEAENGSGISHVSTYKVSDDMLKNLRSGRKYVWNIELRRGTLAIVRTEIVDWIVNDSEGHSLEYGTNGTINN